MLQWLCHDRGLCAVVGLPLWSGSLVVLGLIVVAILSFCSRLRCSQMLAGATLLIAASVPLDGALGSRDGDLLNVSASGGQGVAGARGSSGYDLQVRSHRFDSLWRRFAPNATGVLAVIDVEGFEQEALLGMRRLIRSGTLKWARIEVWTHIHGARRREYPGLALLAQHGYRLCGANGREIKPQHLGALYDSMRRMCRRKFAAPAKPDGILHCQDDIEAFHPKIFDRCGGEHGGFL